MQAFCTITTADHFPLARALYTSLQQHAPGTELYVLVIDKHSFESEENLRIIQPAELAATELFRNIENKYAHTQADRFRWALKPVLIGYLLEKGYSKLIFADPDLFFVGNFDFLFDLLDTYSVLLTPHWADLDFKNNPDSLYTVMTDGLFNAGFIGAGQKGSAAINFWGNLCNYKMERNQELGLYDDQKYLDLLPVQFEQVHSLSHQGCNLASWNIQTCKRELINGQLRINKRFEPVFIHFTRDTIKNILNRNDALLTPFLEEYIAMLKKNGFDLLQKLDDLSPGEFDTAYYKIKHRTRFRTRLKRFFYKLAEKL